MAFEPVLRSWLEERTLLDDPHLLVVDKPPGVVVHGGDVDLGEDLVGRLRAWLRARGDGDTLGVHQRLDRGASGVLLFTRSSRHNAEVSAAFSAHSVGRVYLAAVTGGALPEEGELVDRLVTDPGGPTRVVERGGKLARAHFRVVLRRGSRALVELRPMTGRTHQLRVQLASRGAPIAGDTLYGGAPAWRLMLHATELTVLGHRFVATVPEALGAWVEGRDGVLGPAESIVQGLVLAAWRRAPLARLTDAYRLVNGAGDGAPGVVLDRYRSHAVLALGSDEALARQDELVAATERLGADGVHVKRHVRADLRRVEASLLTPSASSPPDAAVSDVTERGLCFGVQLDAGLSTGLFVDQRDNRVLVRHLSTGARMLNLFAYTCSFTVAAAAGGARETVSVDLSRAALDRGRENLQRNGFTGPTHRLVRGDAVAWLRRARSRGERFELVVLDPPSFGSVRGRAGFVVERDYEAVAADAVALLAPGGRLLAVTNHRQTSRERLRRWLRGAASAAGRTVAQLKDLPSGFDCPPHPDGPSPSKSVLLTVR